MKTCAKCGREIDRSQDYYQQVTAWVANEKRDSVTLRRDVFPARFAHRFCIKEWQLGVNADQGSLL